MRRFASIRRNAAFAACVSGLLIVSTTAVAQVSPGWNRRVTGISLKANPTGGFDVIAEWRLDLQGLSSVPVELGTSVALSINTLPHSTTDSDDCLIWDVTIDNGSGDCTGQPDGQICGTADISGTPVDLTCDRRTDTCSTPTISKTIVGVAMTSGDAIEIALGAASAAERDTGTADDNDGLLAFGSWNRKLVSLDAVPTPGGLTGQFDVTAQVVIEITANSTVPLNVGIETIPVEDECCQEACCCPSCSKECSGNGCGGGSTFATEMVSMSLIICPGPACNMPCAIGQNNAVAFSATCDPVDCVCRSETLTLVWPGVFLPPGGNATVVLRPAPCRSCRDSATT